MEKTVGRIDVESCRNSLHVIPVGPFGETQVFVVSIPKDHRTIVGTNAASRTHVQVNIARFSAHLGGEMPDLALD
jgi:hypothetical protein